MAFHRAAHSNGKSRLIWKIARIARAYRCSCGAQTVGSRSKCTFYLFWLLRMSEFFDLEHTPWRRISVHEYKAKTVLVLYGSSHLCLVKVLRVLMLLSSTSIASKPLFLIHITGPIVTPGCYTHVWLLAGQQHALLPICIILHDVLCGHCGSLETRLWLSEMSWTWWRVS